MTVETFSNPAAATTVTTGGTTAPAALTQETWTVAGGFAGFPGASSAAAYPTFFRIFDPLLSSEIMWVVNTSGSTWTVIRGNEGTTPVAHPAGFAVQQVISGGTLNNFAQTATSDSGLIQAKAGILTQAAISSTTPTTVASLSVAANEPVPGAVYEIDVFGFYSTSAGTPALDIAVQWGSTTVGAQAVGVGTAVTDNNSRFRIRTILVFNTATACYANHSVSMATVNTGATAVPQFMFGPTNSTTVIVSSATTLTLTLAWSTTGGSITVLGGKICRTA